MSVMECDEDRSVRRVILVRHAALGAAWRGRYIGSSDPPLEDDGLRQASALARTVAARKPDLCWCSPLRRARQE